MQVVDTDIEGGLLARLLDALIDELLGLVEHLLDTCGVDASVGDEVLEGYPANLPAHRVKAREHDRLRRVIDNHVDTGELLELADVATLTTDDAALYVI